MTRCHRISLRAMILSAGLGLAVTLWAGPVVAAALTRVALTVTPGSPQQAYTTMTLRAAPTGGTNVEYRFRVAYPNALGQAVWAVLANYGVAASCSWTPTVARYYTLEVSAREAGAATAVKAQRIFRVTPGSPPAPASDGHIAFISRRDGNDEIYLMDPDGGNQTRLTDTPAREMEVAWHPNGSMLIFVSRRTGAYELFSMNADGSNVVRLTTNSAPDWGPTYTPDGANILFFRTLGGTDDILTMSADGANEARLTQNAWFDVLPVMTPDGKAILFDSDRNGSTRQANYDIYRMNPDGSGQTRLTTNPGQDWYHAVSPDGTLIAYTCDDHIAIMNLDGTDQRRLTYPSGYADARPTFSPDGTRLAFASNRDGNWEIYLMNRDGSGQQRITNNSWDDFAPCWGVK